ncbi:MAG: hypothetical protein AB7V14_06560 [Kiritimatiellia bacterium]
MNEEPGVLMLGEYEVPDAQRLLADLEKAQIPFVVRSIDLRARIPSKGAGGRYSRLQIWIRPEDQETAQAIQTRSLKIEL